jgi:hypothetical protein
VSPKEYTFPLDVKNKQWSHPEAIEIIGDASLIFKPSKGEFV